LVVTSRPKPSLAKTIKKIPDKQFCRLEHVQTEESSFDIKVFLTEKLAECSSPVQLEALILEAEADGLFIHVSNAVELMKEHDVGEQRSLLGGLSHSPPISASSLAR
jgi:hypothetical protein